MIDLSCSIRRWNNDVVKPDVDFTIKRKSHFKCSLFFTKPTFE